MNDDALDAAALAFTSGGMRPPSRYAFIEPGGCEWFIPRKAGSEPSRALLERAVAEWLGAPASMENIRLRIHAAAGPLVKAVKQSRYDMLGLWWASRDYPLRGSNPALSRPKPLREGLAGRHARRGGRR